MLDGYPDTWDDFIGQTTAVAQLRVAAASARARHDSMPHVLLSSGQPGIGKTALALLIAKELGTEVRTVTGKVDNNAARLLLASMADRDVLFIDEAHQLVVGGKAKAEWLLHYLQDGVLLGPRGPEEQPRVTVIAATTDGGRIPETILSRFPLRPILEPYTDDEAFQIASRCAVKAFTPLGLLAPKASTVAAIARAGSHNPRTIKAIIENLRDLAVVDLESVFDGSDYDISQALTWLGLSADGLTATARRYLAILATEYDGQAGEAAIKGRLQEPGGLEHTERLLAEKGLIAFTKQGRTLTAAGINRARQETA